LTETSQEREGERVRTDPILSLEEVSPEELWVAGELDRTTADRFDETVRRSIAGSGPLVLDLSRVRFLDSSGVRSLIKLGMSMRGRALVLRAPSPQVMRVLQLTRLDQVGMWRIDETPAPVSIPEASDQSSDARSSR
jgi:anti-sigma B factor antagonist